MKALKRIQVDEMAGKKVKGVIEGNDENVFILFDDDTYILFKAKQEWDMLSLETVDFKPHEWSEELLVNLGICEVGEVTEIRRIEQFERQKRQQEYRRQEYEKMKREFESE